MFACLAACLFAGPVRLDGDGVPLPAEAVCRVGSARWRAADHITDLHCTPDGRTLVALEGRRCLVGWDAGTGFPLHRVPLPDGERAIRLVLPPGQPVARIELVTKKEAFAVARHDPRTGVRLGPAVTLLRRMRDDHDTVILSPGGRYVLEHYPDTVRRYSVDETDAVQSARPADGSGPAVELLRERRSFTVAVSPDDRLIAVAPFYAEEKPPAVVRLIGLPTGQPVRELPVAGAAVSGLAFSPDGSALAGWYGTGDERRTLAVWEVATGRRRDVVTEPGRAEQIRVWFAADGRHLVTESQGCAHDIRTGRRVYQPTEFPLAPVAFDPSGRTAFAQASSYSVTPLGPTVRPVGSERVPDLTPLAFASGGLVVRSESSRRYRVHTFEPTTGLLAARGAPVGSWTFVPRTAVSTDGRVVVNDHDGSEDVELLDTRTGDLRANLQGHTTAVLETRFTADSRRLVTTAKGYFQVWDAATFAPLSNGRLEGYTGQAGAILGMQTRHTMAVSADGRWLAAGEMPEPPADRRKQATEADVVLVWDLRRPGPPVRRLPAPGATRHIAAISPDGMLVAASGPRPEPNGPTVKFGSWEGSVLRVWGIESGRSVLEFVTAEEGMSGPAFSPDERTLAVGLPGRLVLLEVASGAVRHTFVGHAGLVEHPHFSPDGRHLAAASPDAPVFVWDVRGELTKPASVSPTDLDAAVRDLASADAAVAFRAVRRLALFPADALPKLRAALLPVLPLPAGRVAKLLADLDAPRFADRQAAVRELTRLGRAVEPELRAAVADEASAEVRRQAGGLLAKLADGKPTTDDLRAVRAVEAVEWMGTAESRTLLAAWAAGGPHARLTREATAALGRVR